MAMQYEEYRINRLKNERAQLQKKVFTKWINSYLKATFVKDLYKDLRDGRILTELLTGQSSECNDLFRFHKVEKVNRCLQIVEKQLDYGLVNIGAEDIVDGNSTAVLGLLWIIILRFQVQTTVNALAYAKELDQSEVQSGSGHSSNIDAESAMLAWVRKQCSPYGIKVRNFSSSFRDGQAFCALIHSTYGKKAIDITKIAPGANKENLELAFSAAEELGVVRLLEPEEVNVPNPDSRLILTYVVHLLGNKQQPPESSKTNKPAN